MCNGFIVLDKPQKLTSNEAVLKIKKMLNIEKASHAGTLDPNVSGVLIILIGTATKLTHLMQKQDKEYIGTLHLHNDVPESELKNTFNLFRGEIEQMPPVRSAVSRKLRKRKIYELDIMEIRNRDVLFRVSCEAGTYIRKLCHDIGEKIGGAHMTKLRRIKSGSFTEKEALTLKEVSDLKEKSIKPMIELVRDIKKIYVKKTAISNILNGSPLYYKGIKKADDVKKEDTVIMVYENQPIAIGIIKKINPLICKTDRLLKH